jgi:hypothetical protein
MLYIVVYQHITHNYSEIAKYMQCYDIRAPTHMRERVQRTFCLI